MNLALSPLLGLTGQSSLIPLTLTIVCIVHLSHYGEVSLQEPDWGAQRRGGGSQIRIGGSPGKETARWQIINDKELVCES